MSKTSDILDITIKEIEKGLVTNNTYLEKATFLQIETRRLHESILSCQTKLERENLEIYLQALSSVKAQYIVSLLNTKTISQEQAKLYFPTINDPFFNNKIAQVTRFSQYQVPAIQDKKTFFSERNPDFTRTPSQNFVASFITPDTPYNGILLWHGVGAGKTCAALGIAETFLNNHNDLTKKVLVLTPSEQLHSEWRGEIFNLSKEFSKDNYNLYLTNGGQLDYYSWLLGGSPSRDVGKITPTQNQKRMPITNIQCTGNKYNPFKTRIIDDMTRDFDKNKKKLEKVIRQQVNENYEFETYNIIVNKYERHERKLFFNKSKQLEGKLVKYIINEFSNRVIIMDEIHRVREKTEGTGRKGKEANLKKGSSLIYAENSTVYVALKPNTEPVLATVLSIQDNEYKVDKKYSSEPDRDKSSRNITYQLQLSDESNKIVDEIRPDQVWGRTSSMMEQKTMILKMIAKYAVNTKLVLASATPMYSTASEILDILDILLLNDSRPMTVKNAIFKDEYQLRGKTGEAERELAKKALVDAAKGYISYIRGVNPAIFPVRLDPTSQIMENDKSKSYPLTSLGYEPRPIYSFVSGSQDIIRTRLKAEQWIYDPCLTRDIMSPYQLACWAGICQQGFGSGSKKNSEWVFSGLLQGKAPTHASIITFPVLTGDDIISLLENTPLSQETVDNLKVCYGQKGFDHTFNRMENTSKMSRKVDGKSSRRKQTNIKWNIKANLDREFLKLVEPTEEIPTSDQIYSQHFRGLQKYSSKLANITRLVNSCQGIVFIYSEYVVDGVNMMAMALEANGYYRYSKGQTWDDTKLTWSGEDENLLVPELMAQGGDRRNYQGRSFNQIEDQDPQKVQGRYIMLKGEDMSQKVIDDLIAAAKAEDNIEGQQIKVIIGSKKVREGFSLKAVRQIHILDPWYHLNAIDQSTGRGIRNYSHSSLPLEKRNVTVFLHSASLPDLTDENFPRLYDFFQDILPDIDDVEISINEVSEEIVDEKSGKIQEGVETPLTLVESSDEYLYRTAYQHSREIAKVSRYLQKYSVDCKLNIHGNMFPVSLFNQKGINPYPIITSQNKNLPDFKLGNRDNSWQCDFSSCQYTCRPDDPATLTGLRNYKYYIELLPVTDTILETAKKTFKQIFRGKTAATLSEIIKMMTQQKISLKVSYLAIEQVVKNREYVYDVHYRKGYVIFRNQTNHQDAFYIFQPIWLPTVGHGNQVLEDDQDETISPILRTLPAPNSANLVAITEPELELETESEKPEGETILAESSGIDCQDHEESQQLVSNLEKYYLTILSIIDKDLSGYYPNKPRNKLAETSVILKSKADTCEYRIPIPTIQDLLLMAGFSILDPLPETDEYLFLVKVCKWICFRLCLDKPQEEWVNFSSQVSNFEISQTNGLGKIPSLKLCSYYFFLEDLPENIVEKTFGQTTLEVGDRVHVKETFKTKGFDGIVDSLPDQDTKSLYIKDLSSGARKLVETKLLSPLINRRQQIYFGQVRVQVKKDGVTKTLEKILPTTFRLLKVGKTSGPQQLFYKLNYHLIDLDEMAINCQLQQDYSTDNDQYKMTLTDIKPSEISSFYGYSNIQSKTGKCNYTNVEKFTNFTKEEVLKYSLTCFYFKNLLEKREGIGGCCALQSLKQKKVEIINTILTSTNGEPYTKQFSRYSGKNKKQITPVEIVTEGADVEIQKITLCRREGIAPNITYVAGLDNKIKDSATMPIVTLELMLLLRYFRFVNKGYCPNNPLIEHTWYLRKNEALLVNK